MALQVQSGRSALDAPIQGFLDTKTTSRAINNEVWDGPRDQNHIARIHPRVYHHEVLCVTAAKNHIVEIFKVPETLT
jgi:hypothetical protein